MAAGQVSDRKMNDENEKSADALDRLLGDYLHSQLEGQVGRAEKAFAEQAAAHVARVDSGWRRLVWFGGMAVAISAAVLVAVVLKNPPQQGDGAVPAAAAPRQEPKVDRNPRDMVADNDATPPAATTDPPVAAQGEEPKVAAVDSSPRDAVLVDKDVQWRVLDEEIVNLDSNTPMRKVRRQRLEKREYLDREHGARVQTFVPREEVIYRSMTTH
jgi:hypothetical protein